MLFRHTLAAGLLILSACNGGTPKTTVVTTPTATSVTPESRTVSPVAKARLLLARGDEAGARKAFHAAVLAGGAPRVVLAPAPSPPSPQQPFERILDSEPHRWSDTADRAAFQIGDAVIVLDTAEWRMRRFPALLQYEPWRFSRDGNQIAFEHRREEIEIVDSATGAVIKRIEGSDPPGFDRYVPPPRHNGHVLTRGPAGLGAYIPNCCVDPGAAVLVDLKKKRDLGELKAPGCERAATVVFGPKGAPVATTMGRRLCLWDPAKRSLLGFADVAVRRDVLELLDGQYVSFTSDGSAVVVFDPEDDALSGGVLVYDARSAERRQDLGTLHRLDAEAQVYVDAGTHEVVRITGVGDPERHHIDQRPDELLRLGEITTATSKGIAVLDTDTLAVRHLRAEPGRWAVSESPDSKLWAGRHEHGHLRVWSSNGEARLYIPAAPAVETVARLDFLPASSGAPLDVELWSGARVRLDLVAGTAEARAEVPLVPSAPAVAGASDPNLGVPVRSSDGALVAASYGESIDYRDVRVFDAASGKEITVFGGAPLSMSFGKARLAVASFGGGVDVWQARSGKQLYHLDGSARVVALSADDRRLAWIGDDDVASVRDGANGKPICEHKGITSSSTPLAFSSDGQRLVVGDRSRLLVLDSASCAVLADLAIPSEPMAVTIAPSAAVVAAALYDGTVVLYRVSDGAALLTLRVLADAAAAMTADGGVALFGDRARAAALLSCALDDVPFPYDFCAAKAAALPEETLFR